MWCICFLSSSTIFCFNRTISGRNERQRRTVEKSCSEFKWVLSMLSATVCTSRTVLSMSSAPKMVRATISMCTTWLVNTELLLLVKISTSSVFVSGVAGIVETILEWDGHATADVVFSWKTFIKGKIPLIFDLIPPSTAWGPRGTAPVLRKCQTARGWRWLSCRDPPGAGGADEALGKDSPWAPCRWSPGYTCSWCNARWGETYFNVVTLTNEKMMCSFATLWF